MLELGSHFASVVIAALWVNGQLKKADELEAENELWAYLRQEVMNIREAKV